MKVIIEVEYHKDTDTVQAISHTEGGEYDPEEPVCMVADKMLGLWQAHVEKLTKAYYGGHV